MRACTAAQAPLLMARGLLARQIAALRRFDQNFSAISTLGVHSPLSMALAIAVEVQPDTSRLVVASRCWTLCYRYADTLLPLG